MPPGTMAPVVWPLEATSWAIADGVLVEDARVVEAGGDRDRVEGVGERPAGGASAVGEVREAGRAISEEVVRPLGTSRCGT